MRSVVSLTLRPLYLQVPTDKRLNHAQSWCRHCRREKSLCCLWVRDSDYSLVHSTEESQRRLSYTGSQTEIWEFGVYSQALTRTSVALWLPDTCSYWLMSRKEIIPVRFQASIAVQSACPFFREEQRPDAACNIYPEDEENIGLFIRKLAATCPKQTTARPRRPQYEFSQQWRS